jgi:SAM-dependent methyltransferase
MDLTPEAIWRLYDETESRLTGPVSERMLDLAGIRPGMRVLDLAGGRGEPALRAARRVGPQGLVVTVELDEALLGIAKEKAARDGLLNIDFRTARAESVSDVPPAQFDAATIRWGLMYMESPLAALATAHRALLPTGTLVAALWAEPERVPYYTLPRRLLEPDRRLPAFDPEAPGTFRYADRGRLVRDFERAGFTVTHVEEMDTPVFEAESAAQIVAWARNLGLVQRMNALSDSVQRVWEEELTTELERRRQGTVIRLGGVTRIVQAHRRQTS